MNYSKKFYEFMNNNNGYITNRLTRELGIPSIYLSRMVETNEIVRVERGIYILPTYLDDELYIYHLKHKRIIYNTGSVALSLNGMSNTSIRQIEANIPLNYNLHRIENIKINRVNSKLYNLGKTFLKTSFGNLVPTYDKERVICDIYANNDLDLE